MMINKLKSGKATGIDKITAELLKNLDDDTVIIIDSGEFREEWALRNLCYTIQRRSRSKK